jgi:hypothetical protein
MQWENVNVFISSTFNDMHAERDYLVKSVFPALSEWCEERKLRLIDIDLRWGVTAADSEAKNTVRACLRNIDACRPFFLCFLGQRRGWVPSADDIGGDTYEMFPNLVKNNYVEKTSVTEMEILHALIDPLHNGILRGTKDDSRSGEAVEHAFFYLREPAYLANLPHQDLRTIYTNEIEDDPVTADRELTHWREQEIPKTGRPVYSYTADWQLNESTPEIALPLCVPTTAPKESRSWENAFAGWKKKWVAVGVNVDESGEITGMELERAKAYNVALTQGRLSDFQVGDRSLANVIVEQLKAAITARYPEHMAMDEQTPLQKEIDQQAQFLRLAGEGFIERAGDFDVLNDYLQNNESRPLAVTAYAGMGKTSLLAHFIDSYQRRGDTSLHYRFIGASDDSVSTERLVRSFLSELKLAGKLQNDIPVNSADMMTKLPDLLANIGKSGKTILVIDALNQLESNMNDLYWIPAALPENIKLIVSFKRGEDSADEYYQSQKESGSMILHSIKSFDDRADRKALVSAYLEQYFKELDEPRIQAMIESDGAENPLFLKAALSELRVFGVHNDLSEVIRTRFGTTPVQAFHAILKRMESDPAYTRVTPAVALPHVFGWIAHSRRGMSVEELVDLLVRENLADDKAYAMDAVYLIIRQLRPFLAKRDGRLDFFYESFKIAAVELYTGDHPYARTASEWHKSLAEYFETLPLENRHRLMEQAWHYANAGMGDQLIELIWDYHYQKAKLFAGFIDQMIEEYDSVKRLPELEQETPDVKLLKRFLSMSYEVLSDDPNQLASRLFGTFIGDKQPRIAALLEQAAETEQGPWICPLDKYFPLPQSSFISSRTLGQYQDIGNIFSLDNHEFLVYTKEELQIWDVDKLIRKKTIPLKFGHIASNQETYISAEKHYIAIADTSKFMDTISISVADVQTGERISLYQGQFPGTSVTIHCCDFSKNNDTLMFYQVIGTSRHQIVLFDIAKQEEVSRYTIVDGESSNSYSARYAYFTDNENVILVNLGDQILRTYDLFQSKELAQQECVGSFETDKHSCLVGSTLVSFSGVTLNFYDADIVSESDFRMDGDQIGNYEQVESIQPRAGWFHVPLDYFAKSPDGKYGIFTMGGESFLINIPDRKTVMDDLVQHRHRDFNYDYDSSGRFLLGYGNIIADNDVAYYIEIIDLLNQKIVQQRKLPEIDADFFERGAASIRFIGFANDGKNLVAVLWSGIALIDIESMKLVQRWDAEAIYGCHRMDDTHLVVYYLGSDWLSPYPSAPNSMDIYDVWNTTVDAKIYLECQREAYQFSYNGYIFNLVEAYGQAFTFNAYHIGSGKKVASFTLPSETERTALREDMIYDYNWDWQEGRSRKYYRSALKNFRIH